MRGIKAQDVGIGLCREHRPPEEPSVGVIHLWEIRPWVNMCIKCGVIIRSVDVLDWGCKFWQLHYIKGRIADCDIDSRYCEVCTVCNGERKLMNEITNALENCIYCDGKGVQIK